MSEIDVTLSHAGENMGIFHDFQYTNDNSASNSNRMTFRVENVSGNGIVVEGCFLRQDKYGKWERNWYDLGNGEEFDGVRIRITGSIENGEFLQMLQLILDAEKMVEIIKP